MSHDGGNTFRVIKDVLQKELGYTGLGANGIPGEASLKKLATNRFTVEFVVRPGARVPFDGKTVDARTSAMLTEAASVLGSPLRLDQGGVGVAQVAQRVALAFAVADLAGDGQVLLVELDGPLRLTQGGAGEAQVAQRAALAFAALDQDVASHRTHELPADAEAKSRAATMPLFGAGLFERFEDRAGEEGFFGGEVEEQERFGDPGAVGDLFGCGGCVALFGKYRGGVLKELLRGGAPWPATIAGSSSTTKMRVILYPLPAKGW